MNKLKPKPHSEHDAPDSEPERWRAFARILREARQRRRLTLKDVSNELGLADGHLAAIENGKTPNPGIQTVFKLAAFYNVSIDTLTGYTQVQRTPEAVLAAELMDRELDEAERGWALECIESVATFSRRRRTNKGESSGL